MTDNFIILPFIGNKFERITLTDLNENLINTLLDEFIKLDITHTFYIVKTLLIQIAYTSSVFSGCFNPRLINKENFNPHIKSLINKSPDQLKFDIWNLCLHLKKLIEIFDIHTPLKPYYLYYPFPKCLCSACTTIPLHKIHQHPIFSWFHDVYNEEMINNIGRKIILHNPKNYIDGDHPHVIIGVQRLKDETIGYRVQLIGLNSNGIEDIFGRVIALQDIKKWLDKNLGIEV